MTAAKALALVKTSRSISGTIIAPAKSTLSRSQQQKAIRILSPYLPTGFLHYMPIRRYGRYLGIPLLCPVCRKTARELIKEDGKNPDVFSHRQKVRYMRMHPYEHLAVGRR